MADLELVPNTPDDEESEADLDLEGFRVTLQPHDWTVSGLVELMRNGRIDISPSWQRRDAWDNVRRSQFIESLLLELPVPQIVLAERQDRPNHYVVIDGKQRLSTLRRFLSLPGEGTEGFALRGLPVLGQLDGMTLDSIRASDEFQYLGDRLLDSSVRTVVIRNWLRPDYLHFVFLRLNQGTLPLKPQELRQALLPGPFTQFADLTSLDAGVLHEVMGSPGPDPRMQDAEMVVRFIGFRFFLNRYAGNLKAFLDTTCEELNARWDDQQEAVTEAWNEGIQALQACQEIFGEHACRLWLHGRPQRSFNRAVFDAMAYYFGSAGVRESALTKADRVRDAFIELCRDDADFVTASQTTTKTPRATYKRLRAWGDKLQAIGVPAEVPSFDDNRNRITV